MGRWGQFNLWLYNEYYVDDNGYEQPMLPDGYILISGPDMMGTRAFGMIIDPAFNYQPMAYAPKTWLNEDPGAALPDDAVLAAGHPQPRERGDGREGALRAPALTP